MGGYGSGYGWWLRKRRTVEATPCIDADHRMLRYKKKLEPDQMSMRILPYGYLEATMTPLGHRRWWWLCPECGHRRKKLYYISFLDYKCRKCLGLTYARCQKNRRPSKFERMIFGPDAAMFERCMHWDDKDANAWDYRQWWRREKRQIRM